MRTEHVTGSTIQSALKEARHRFGDDVVLIESRPADNGEPARITVMADTPLPESKQPATPAGPSGATRSSETKQLAGYGPGMRRFNEAQSEGTAVTAGEKDSDRDTDVAVQSPPAERTSSNNETPSSTPPQSRAEGPGRNRLFPGLGESDASANGAASEHLLENQLKRLNSRLETMERRFGGAVIGSTQAWMANPLTTELMEQGLRPSTLNKVFDRLVSRGFEPDDEPDDLRWAVAQELRRLISDVAAPKQSRGPLLCIGPSGAGKTSLLLKLAVNDAFYGRHRPTVISIMPADDSIPYQNPAELYRSFGVPVQNVRSTDEMEEALQRASAFDQMLIDTPPLPVQPKEAHRMLKRIKQMVRSLLPLQIHFTLNATRTLEDFESDFFRRLPLRPDSVALTHLDESTRWGRVAEWLLSLDLPIQFVSTGPRVPSGVEPFSPTWYIEEMMDL